MKVGSLFAEIGFKVNDSGFKKFSKAMEDFHKSIKAGLKDLKAYAKAAKEISKAMKNAYMPTSSEAKARYNAETQRILAQAKLADRRARNLTRDSKTKALNAITKSRQLDLKERNLGKSASSRSAIKKILTGILGANLGGILGGVGGLFGGVGAVIGVAIEKLIGAMWKMATWLGRTFMQGIKIGLAYRDYRAFTGRNARGLSDLMYASFGTSSMMPEDVLKDAAGFERGFWDIYFGEGNVRPWQALGITPTGNGGVDLRNVLGAVGSIKNRGLQRKLLGDFGLSEDYVNLMDSLSAKNPTKTFSEILDMTLDSIDSISDANFALKEFGWQLDQVKVKIVDAVVRSGLLDALKKLEPVIQDIMIKLVGVLEKILPMFSTLLSRLNAWLAEKLMSPEERKEYLKYKMVKDMGKDAFYKNLGLYAADYASQGEWNKGNYLKALTRGMSPYQSATGREKVAFLTDTYHISVNSVDDIPKAFDMIVERHEKMINGAVGINGADVSTSGAF